ncbi:MAG: HigA family addiction module antidote protein [Gemmatimonadales bacterium]|nr:HigA family addiction module antidote protein [Gemmatimonadales bacterium]
MSNRTVNEYNPDVVTCPGETLEELLEDIEMSQAELSRRTGRATKTINGIVHGREPLTPDTALQFEKVLGVKARFWNELERNYREHLARVNEAQKLADNVSWLKCLPVAAMKKRGWLPGSTDKVALVDAALRFFGVASVREWNEVSLSSQFAYRKSDKVAAKPGHMATWLRAGEIDAQSISCNEFDKNMFKTALTHLRSLTTASPEIFQVEIVEHCAAAGVAVVFVPEIKGAPISGATRWLNKNKAMIQLSLRYKTHDQLWFSLFHEAGHILLHGKKEIFLEINDGSNVAEEEEADCFARDQLISARAYADFVSSTRICKSVVQEFAEEIGIHPGIVVGRLQHERRIPYKNLNGLKMKLQWTS